MMGSGRCAGRRVVWVVLLTVSGFPALASDAGIDLALDNLRITRDRAIDRSRVNCAANSMQEVKRDVLERGYSFPAAELYCRTVMEEVARRGRGSVLYELLGDGDGSAAFAAVTQAALEDAGRFAKPSGENVPLDCGLAFDAGFVFGHQWPDDPLAASYAAERARDVAQRCYSEPALAGTREGLLAGAWFGRQWANP